MKSRTRGNQTRDMDLGRVALTVNRRKEETKGHQTREIWTWVITPDSEETKGNQRRPKEIKGDQGIKMATRWQQDGNKMATRW